MSTPRGVVDAKRSIIAIACDMSAFERTIRTLTAMAALPLCDSIAMSIVTRPSTDFCKPNTIPARIECMLTAASMSKGDLRWRKVSRAPFPRLALLLPNQRYVMFCP
eukprot:scaffold635_cov535-Prasinococcus_capsulatus_cf.AAC.8